MNLHFILVENSIIPIRALISRKLPLLFDRGVDFPIEFPLANQETLVFYAFLVTYKRLLLTFYVRT